MTRLSWAYSFIFVREIPDSWETNLLRLSKCLTHVCLLPGLTTATPFVEWFNVMRPIGDTPLNNPPIEIHKNSSMFALVFWPYVTIFWIFWLHECLKWRNQFVDVNLGKRAIEQRHHEFQLIHYHGMPPHQFWPRYHSDGLYGGLYRPWMFVLE